MAEKLVDNIRSVYSPHRAAVALSEGDLVLLNSAGRWVKASNTSDSLVPALGVVTRKTDRAGCPEVAQECEIAGYSGLTVGGEVYLGTNGDVTQTRPSLMQKLGVAKNSRTIIFAIEPALGADAAKLAEPYKNVSVVQDGESIQSKVNAASSGDDIEIKAGTYAEDVTVPTGINLIGSGTNCVLDGNLILQGTANARGIVISEGYFVEQDGVKHYG